MAVLWFCVSDVRKMNFSLPRKIWNDAPIFLLQYKDLISSTTLNGHILTILKLKLQLWSTLIFQTGLVYRSKNAVLNFNFSLKVGFLGWLELWNYVIIHNSQIRVFHFITFILCNLIFFNSLLKAPFIYLLGQCMLLFTFLLLFFRSWIDKFFKIFWFKK